MTDSHAFVNPALMDSLKGSRFLESACTADTVSMYSIDYCHWAGTTPYCEAVIAQSPVHGKVLFIDKEIQSAESDERIYHEHLVHPVMAATASRLARKVLIVGGGEGATAREVLRYSTESVALVHWVDIDKPLVDLCRRHLYFAEDSVYNDPRLVYFGQDIRTFLSETEVEYDVVILDLPDADVDELIAVSAAETAATTAVTAVTAAPAPTTVAEPVAAVAAVPAPTATTTVPAPTTVAETTGVFPLYGHRFFTALRSCLTEGGAIASHAGPIAPGGNPVETRAGLSWIQGIAAEIGIGAGHAYHVGIPSFQGEWGFWMSVPPAVAPVFPEALCVMDATTQTYAFTWPAYWTSPFVGHVIV